MKTTLIILFAVVSNIANSQIKRDKVLHFSAGIVVGGITAYVSERTGLTENKFQTLVLSTTVSTAVAVGKEVYDKYVKGTFVNERDIVWTVIGGVVGGVSLTYTIKPRQKRNLPIF